MAEAADPHAARRAEILAASLATANTRCWGYFGMTGPLAIGDNSYAPRLMKKEKPAEEGEPLKNICGGPTKKGAATDVYFTFETPLALGDPYIDASQREKKGKARSCDGVSRAEL